TPLIRKTGSNNPYFLEKWHDTGYYFYYEKDRLTTLDMEFLATIDVAAEQHLIYADKCLLEQDFLTNNRIIFKKIPRDITRF
ncbi:MAG: site-specific DNA-methyltransferase, partial [Bacteroidota bacterium]